MRSWMQVGAVAIICLGLIFVTVLWAVKDDKERFARLCEKLGAEASYDFGYHCIRDGKVVYTSE